MDDISMAGAYLTDGGDAEELARALQAWFLETQCVEAIGDVPAHVVAWAPRAGTLSMRARAAVALAGYEAGAREIWLLADDGEVLLPRLHRGGAATTRELVSAGTHL
jgi:hypothetical protein